MLANYHTHTTLCDGKNTPTEIAAEAYRKGFAALGFSGHMDPNIHMDWKAYCDQIRSLQTGYSGKLDILLGVELDQFWPRDTVLDAEYVIGSTHFIPLPDGKLGCVDHAVDETWRVCRDYYDGDWYRISAAYYEVEAQVWEKTHCDIIGHFDLITRFNHEYPCFDETDPRYLRHAMDALDVLARTGAVFEINCGAYNRGRRRDFYPAQPLLKLLQELKAPVCLSSDAHTASLLDSGFEAARDALQSCGFREITIWKHDGFAGTVIRSEEKL